jgi:methylated-DNA-protein-cysteine methyltransferase-like protein
MVEKLNPQADFFTRVYAVVVQIPIGRVTSYGAIAKFLGAKSSSRMVGYAMNAAHTMPEVPAHRVVNRLGLLTGKHHFPTHTAMQEALQAEGTSIVDDKVQDFNSKFWDPELLLK